MLIEYFDIKFKHLTVYCPQINNQTERINQTLEIFLRYYINKKMDNWVELLLEAEIALANKESAATKQRPQERINNNIVINIRNPSNEATIKVYEIKALQGIEGLEVGDKVYLLIQNFRTTRPNKKLDYKKIGPFRIISKLGPAIRKLQLFKNAKVYPMFIVSLLHLASPNTPL